MNSHGAGTPQPRKCETTVLIADDDPAVRSVLARVLKQNDFTVLTACDGAQALALAKDCGGSIDLLITDFEMPHLTGIQLAAAMRELYPHIIVVLMSGLPKESTSGSVSTFLRKPFTPLTLLETITTLLGQH